MCDTSVLLVVGDVPISTTIIYSKRLIISVYTTTKRNKKQFIKSLSLRNRVL